MSTLTVVFVSVGLIFAVPVLTLFMQVIMTLPRQSKTKIPAGRRPHVAVLIPAHNEQEVIEKTLLSISNQLMAGDRVIVVADNCSDRTADIARQFGADVTIRSNPVLRGKGYALDHGLKFIEQLITPEVIIFIDADCHAEDGCIDRLARQCAQSLRPIQATYLMNPPRPPQKMASIVAFAWKVKDFVRPLGWHRLGFPCQLAGSGMAVPWEIVHMINLASGHLSEDLKLGLDLALIGRFSLFCPDAVVTSGVIAGDEPSHSQRARWEHGSIEAMVRYLPRLIGSIFRMRSFQLLGVVLDLCVPPLALLALALGSYLASALLLFILSGANAPIILSIIICTIFITAIILAWWRHGQDIIPLRWLMYAPVYAFLKIPLYIRFLLNRQQEWVKGERVSRGKI
jgi:cellulose synthase/poly-beta-1,6-N-acetylglucosamine synthase-like glycosyltransferase